MQRVIAHQPSDPSAFPIDLAYSVEVALLCEVDIDGRHVILCFPFSVVQCHVHVLSICCGGFFLRVLTECRGGLESGSSKRALSAYTRVSVCVHGALRFAVAIVDCRIDRLRRH